MGDWEGLGRGVDQCEAQWKFSGGSVGVLGGGGGDCDGDCGGDCDGDCGVTIGVTSAPFRSLAPPFPAPNPPLDSRVLALHEHLQRAHHPLIRQLLGYL